MFTYIYIYISNIHVYVNIYIYFYTHIYIYIYLHPVSDRIRHLKLPDPNGQTGLGAKARTWARQTGMETFLAPTLILTSHARDKRFWYIDVGTCLGALVLMVEHRRCVVGISAILLSVLLAHHPFCYQ